MNKESKIGTCSVRNMNAVVEKRFYRCLAVRQILQNIRGKEGEFGEYLIAEHLSLGA
jgi:hypothetical protein